MLTQKLRFLIFISPDIKKPRLFGDMGLLTRLGAIEL